MCLLAGEVGLGNEAPLALQGGNLTDDDIIADSSSTSRITACAMYNDASGWLASQLPASLCQHFAVVCRANGALEVFALPDMARVWAADDVADLPMVLTARDDVSSASAGAAHAGPSHVHDMQTVIHMPQGDWAYCLDMCVRILKSLLPL